jgi:hypothetical protein
MKKKIKIIDIFCKINCGEEVPHKIIYENHIYTYNSDVQDYDLNDNCEYLFEHLFTYKDTSIILELELEILDEEDEFEDIEEMVKLNNVSNSSDLIALSQMQWENNCHIERKINQLIKNQKKIIERLKNE